MIEILIALLGSAAILIAGIPLFRGEKNLRQRRYIVAGNLIALLIIWGQYVQQHFDSKADELRHSELTAQNKRLESQGEQDALRHAELVKQYKTVLDQNAALSSKLEPILRIAQTKHPGLGESEAVDRLVQELDKLNPHLEFLPDRTVVREGVDGGPLQTTFVFRPRHPVIVRDAYLDLVFDAPIHSANMKARNTLPFTDNLTLRITSPLSLNARATMVGEAGWLEISVMSKQPVKIARSTIRP